MKSALLFFFGVLSLGFASLGGAPGGYSPVPDTTKIQTQIDFAVKHVVKNNADFVLHYSNLVSARQQVVAGMNYELVLQFDVLSSKRGHGKIPKSIVFKVIVHQALDQALSVTSAVKTSQKSKCAPGAPCKHSTNDPWVTRAANAAVSELSTKLGSVLSLTQIISAQTQIVAGVNYILVIKVTGGGHTAMFDVTVYRDLKDNLSLSKFKQESSIGKGQGLPLGPGPVIGGTGLGQQKQKNVVGGYRPCNLQDPIKKKIVTAAAKFALREISKEIKQPMTYLGFVNPMEQVVAGTNFRFDVEGGVTPGSRVYTVVVFMPLKVGQYLSNPDTIPFQLKSYRETVVSMPR